MLNSDDLRFFCVIADHISLAAAARNLNVTPPTVTQRLQSIENKLQIKLVNRQARSSSLTDEGQLLAEKARFILGEMEDLHEMLLCQKNQVTGRLRILAPLGFGRRHIAPLVAEFKQAHPNLSVELELSDNADRSSTTPWDIMIFIGKPRDSTLRQSQLLPNKRYLCAAPAYLEKYGTPKTPEDLQHHSCIALRENAEDVTLWRFEERSGTKHRATRINPAFACNDGDVVKQWALNGQGIVMRSQWDVAEDIAHGRLVQLLPDHQLPDANIVALLGSEQRARSARTIKFLDLLKKRLRPQSSD